MNIVKTRLLRPIRFCLVRALGLMCIWWRWKRFMHPIGAGSFTASLPCEAPSLFWREICWALILLPWGNSGRRIVWATGSMWRVKSAGLASRSSVLMKWDWRWKQAITSTPICGWRWATTLVRQTIATSAAIRMACMSPSA